MKNKNCLENHPTILDFFFRILDNDWVGLGIASKLFFAAGDERIMPSSSRYYIQLANLVNRENESETRNRNSLA